jgi:hypothetical protein
LPLILVACGDSTDGGQVCTDCADGGGDGDGSAFVLPAAVCADAVAWAAGTPAFREATDDWNLGALEVEGTRINVADIDSDGLADLLVRRGPAAMDPADAELPVYTRLLRNTGERFVDVTWDSGVLFTREAYEDDAGRPIGVAAFGDVDNDGDLDLYAGVPTEAPDAVREERSEILINVGGGLFDLTLASNEVRRAGLTDAPAGASFVDVDRDGLLDLWVSQHGYTEDGAFVPAADRLFRGSGDGYFADITESSGLLTADWVDIATMNAGLAHSRAWSAAACDLNNDGVTELLAASYGRAPNLLWQGERSESGVTFANRSVASGYAYDDNFSWTDNQFAACYCLDHPTADGCDAAGEPEVICSTPNWSHETDREAFRLGGNSGATVCADLDNDGFADLVTTEIKHWWAGEGADGAQILRNTGAADVTFERLSREESGLEVPHVTTGGWDEGIMSAAAFDFDNDGWLDVYLGGSDYAGNRGLLYHQVAPMVFELVTTDDSFEHNRSHGVASADFDRDGDLDVIVGHSRSRCDASAPHDCYATQQVRLFENIAGDGQNWVQLRLEGGVDTNRSAIGARVVVQTEAGSQSRQVGGGYGHYGAQDDLVVHFGLGEACAATVTVFWPDATGSSETFEVVSGYRFAVVQGRGVTGVDAAPTADQ